MRDVDSLISILVGPETGAPPSYVVVLVPQSGNETPFQGPQQYPHVTGGKRVSGVLMTQS